MDSWESFVNTLEELLFLIIRLIPVAILGLIIIIPIFKILKKKGKLSKKTNKKLNNEKTDSKE